MKIVIAPDSYKESLTAKQVCHAIETGFKRTLPNATYISVPVADGGEGTVQSLVDATQGRIVNTRVTGPLGNQVDAFYGLLGDSPATAVIEMAAASGLHHVPTTLRDPTKTSSYGTGELIKQAINQGAKKLIIGLGGSATNDGGLGMMSALGVRFINSDGFDVASTGEGLINIKHIDISQLDARLSDCQILVACDVDNPLCGEQGASATFGPQKGATPACVEFLDQGLAHYSERIKHCLGIDVKNKPGAGAAGGMGAALMAFTNVTLKPGIELVLETLKLESYMQDVDLVITGEGRIDGQTAYGKTPMGVAQVAKKYNIPVIGIAGCLGENYQQVYQCGIDAVFAATPGAMSLTQALQNAEQNVTNLAQNIAQLWAVKLSR
jgi:glycerate kinase